MCLNEDYWLAHLYFYTKDEGGQDKLISNSFSTPISFDESTNRIYGLWSAVINFITPPNEHREATAEIYLLFHDKGEAPNHLIESGREFVLLPKIAIGKFTSVRSEQ